VTKYQSQQRRRSVYDDQRGVGQAHPQRSPHRRRRSPLWLLAIAGVLGSAAVIALVVTSLGGRVSGTSQLVPTLTAPTSSTPTLGTPTLAIASASIGASSAGASSIAASWPDTRSNSLITGGDSKAHCASLNFPGGVLTQSVIDAARKATGITFNCLSVFDNAVPTWDAWEDPWMLHIASDGWQGWLSASAKHQLVLSQDLIPKSVANNANPLPWEQACAKGDYDQYATALAQNLISYGAGKTVIRLGTEANGSWETDYTGPTTAELNAWAKCYAKEVTAMRAVPGAHFLFVWNPNACTHDLPMSEWYPGNSYVDIIGADNYDKDCRTLLTVAQEGWNTYATDATYENAGDPDFPSLAHVAAFAANHGKPMSFPEWGLPTNDDDPVYVAQLARMFYSQDFAYESYFDNNSDGVAPFGSSIPKATAAYANAFK